MSVTRGLWVVTSTAVVYFFACKVNDLLFASIGYAAGVHWVFLPSGLRLVFVLVFGWLGALGIALASFVIASPWSSQLGLLDCAVTGFISGFAPLLARAISIYGLGLRANLEGLTGLTLLKTALVFAVISPVLHQLWYTWNRDTQEFLANTSVMIVGDLLGTLIVLYLGKHGIEWLTGKFPKN